MTDVVADIVAGNEGDGRERWLLNHMCQRGGCVDGKRATLGDKKKEAVASSFTGEVIDDVTQVPTLATTSKHHSGNSLSVTDLSSLMTARDWQTSTATIFLSSDWLSGNE